MARILNENNNEFWRVKVTTQRGRYGYESQQWEPRLDESGNTILSTTIYGPYTSRSVASSVASGSYSYYSAQLIEKRLQKLTAVGTITTVTDENGNETKTLGARLEWVDA